MIRRLRASEAMATALSTTTIQVGTARASPIQGRTKGRMAYCSVQRSAESRSPKVRARCAPAGSGWGAVRSASAMAPAGGTVPISSIAMLNLVPGDHPCVSQRPAYYPLSHPQPLQEERHEAGDIDLHGDGDGRPAVLDQP